MKKTPIVIIGAIVLGIMTSCVSDPTASDVCLKYHKKVAKELGKNAPGNFAEALTAYDFNAAHKYYDACHDEEMTETLFRAEAAYLLSHGESTKAETLAKEMDQSDLYTEILAEEIPSMIKEKKYDEVVSILASWPFKYTYNSELLNFPLDAISTPVPDKKDKNHAGVMIIYTNQEKNNANYNEEMRKYNAIIDNLLASAILEEDINIIKKCIKLYGPTATIKSKMQQKGYSHGRYDFKFELSYQDREEAKKEVASAGIKL